MLINAKKIFFLEDRSSIATCDPSVVIYEPFVAIADLLLQHMNNLLQQMTLLLL